jgi:hypothetical protein
MQHHHLGCTYTKSMARHMSLHIDSTIRLPSGAHIPRLGLGVYQARSAECVEAVKVAIEAGYRHSASNRCTVPLRRASSLRPLARVSHNLEGRTQRERGQLGVHDFVSRTMAARPMDCVHTDMDGYWTSSQGSRTLMPSRYCPGIPQRRP